MDFLTIKNEYFSELIVKKSRFIANIFPCTKSEDFKNKYDMIKKKFFDATHIIPVYRILESNNRIKEHFSDDREPAKTAGWPILYILQQKSLIQIGVLVIRYFGGIKLGTSGLTKAYSQVVLNTIKEDRLIPYKEYISFTLEIPVEKEYFFHEVVKSKEFQDKIKIISTNYYEKNSSGYANFDLQTDKETASLLIERLKKNIEIINYSL